MAYALRTANLDLRTETTQEYGAPPLLAERAKQGALDAVLNFWPYAARLEAEGFTQLIGVEDVVSELGAKGEVAMVGYVFSESWAKQNPEAIQGFLRAAAKADELLATSNEEWERLKPIDERERSQLHRRHLRGAATPLSRGHSRNARSPRMRSDAKILYQFLRELGGEKLVGPGTELAPGTFWHGRQAMSVTFARADDRAVVAPLARPSRLGPLGRGLPADLVHRRRDRAEPASAGTRRGA